MALNFNSLISVSSLNNRNNIRERDKNDTCEHVDIVIKELSVNNSDQWSKLAGETWKCVFSSDELYFAFQSAHIVNLVPKYSYLDKNVSNTGLTINCGDLVRSLSFVKVEDVEALSRNFWPKSAKCKQLFLATGLADGKILIWDTIEGKLLLKLNDHKAAVTELATNPIDNSVLISCSHDGTVKIRDLLNEGELIKTFSLEGQQIESVQESPNGQLLAAAGSNGIIYVWSMSNYELIDRLIGHRNRISSISFSPDSRRLASVSFDSTCMLWNLSNGQKIAQYNHLNPEPTYIFANAQDNGYICRSVCFSPDNHHLITVCDDNSDSKLRVWDIDVFQPISSFQIMNAIFCTYSPTGSYLCVSTKNGSVLIMKTPKSVKSLLSLCRTEISKNNLYKESKENEQRTLPKELVTYLNYE